MGVNFEFALSAEDSISGNKGLEAAIQKSIEIENLISSWKETSQTSTINQFAGIKPVIVNAELYDLIERSIHVSKLTQGAFDISFASINPYWDFKQHKINKIDTIAISNSVQKINYKNIILNAEDKSVFLKEKGMKIGFGAIGKGYLAEVIMQLWKKMGFKAGLINASGDIRTFGNHPNTTNWKIGISNPDKPQDYLAWFNLNNSAVVTSGDYENYVLINGERYSHIINPLTGWPVKGIKSVTIFCENAELADALATAVTVMGKEKGLTFINQLKGIECLIIDNENKISFSKNLKTKYQ